MDREEMNKKMSQIIAKAWSDADFKPKLLANPAETLQAEGIEFPAGIKVNVVENTKEHFYFVLPNPPDELTDEEIDNVAGGIPMRSWPCSKPVAGCMPLSRSRSLSRNQVTEFLPVITSEKCLPIISLL